MKNKKALRVICEGTDGAGKTTGLKYVLEKLQEKNKKVLETREVGNPHIPVCVELRKTVLNPENEMAGEAMEFVFAAMRMENDRFYKKIEKNYDFIVSDRGWLSHLAYTDHNVSKEFTGDFYLNFLSKITQMPDVVIYFAVDGKTALDRRVRRGEEADAIELKGVEYQEKVRDSFKKYLYAYEEDVRIFEIDANQDLVGVKKQLDAVVDSLLS